MVLGRAAGLVRGSVAWAFGYGLILVLVVVGVVDGAGEALVTAARVYLGAHVLVPEVGDSLLLLAVPVVVVALAGYDAGRAFRPGVTGRLRAAVRSFLGRRRTITHAVASGTLLATGYAVTAAVVAVFVEAGIVAAVVGSLLTGLVVGVPSAVVGAVR